MMPSNRVNKYFVVAVVPQETKGKAPPHGSPTPWSTSGPTSGSMILIVSEASEQRVLHDIYRHMYVYMHVTKYTYRYMMHVCILISCIHT